jgi:starch synthase (maltosyl-transferring)
MSPIPHGNDRWRGECAFFENARFEFTIEAWSDAFRTWQHEFDAKFKASQPDLRTETLEGALLMEKAAALAQKSKHRPDAERLLQLAAEFRQSSPMKSTR